MPRASVLIVGSIPVIVAILIIAPLLAAERVPPSALLPGDVLDIEYTHQSIVMQQGVIERSYADESRILEISDGGDATLLVTAGLETTEYGADVDAESFHRLRALIRETGFMQITPVSFMPDVQPGEFDLYTISVTLNGITKNVRWSEYDSQEHLVPPIIIMIRDELDAIRDTL